MPDRESASVPIPDKTTFRVLMDQLLARTGEVPELPTLLHALLSMTYGQQKELGFEYSGEVFKDRDENDPTKATQPEKPRVRDLYHLCHERTGGCFTVGSSVYWLLGYEWPNQGSEKMRRADLVGLNTSGGLVVFECKLDRNPYGPFASILEGLDYLTCRTSEANFLKIQTGFSVWRMKNGRAIPPGFENCCPDRSQRHQVVVLAPQAYFSLYSRTGRGLGWDLFAGLDDAKPSSVSIRFAQSDFDNPIGTWVTTVPAV